MLLWEDNIKWVPDKNVSQDALVKMHVQLMHSVGGTVRGMTVSLEVASEVAKIEVEQGETDDGTRINNEKSKATRSNGGDGGDGSGSSGSRAKRRRKRKAKGQRTTGDLSVIQ